MTVIDNLQVLISADSANIETVLKKTLSTVTGVVGQMNKQEVDWTSIFSRAVSPAIIAGVASMFAYSIEQAVEFQEQMTNTGLTVGDTTNQIGALGEATQGIYDTSLGSSQQQIAGAMTQLGTVFGQGSETTTNLTQSMAELAPTFGALPDIVQASLTVFKQFGATTQTQATQVLTDLMHAAQATGESIPTLVSQFSNFSQQLPASTKNVNSLNQMMSTFAAEIVQLGPEGAENIFKALADSSNSKAGPMEILGQSLQSVDDSLLKNGGLSAIEQLSTQLLKMGPGAALVASGFKLSAEQVSQFQTNAKNLPQVAANAKQIATNVGTIADVMNTKINTAQGSWELFFHTIKTDMQSFGSLFSPVVQKTGQGLNMILNTTTGAISDAINSYGGLLAKVTGVPSTVTGSNYSAGNPQGALYSQLGNLLSGTGVNIGGGGMLNIEDTAVSAGSGMLQSLIYALQTGIKQGQYTSLVNTFHLNVPEGAQGLTAKMIATQLYNQFQGTSGY